jgi:hypothetical protein
MSEEAAVRAVCAELAVAEAALVSARDRPPDVGSAGPWGARQQLVAVAIARALHEIDGARAALEHGAET